MKLKRLRATLPFRILTALILGMALLCGNATSCGKNKRTPSLSESFLTDGTASRNQLTLDVRREVALSDVISEVKTLPVPPGVNGAIFQMLAEELVTLLNASNLNRVVSLPPIGEGNKVKNLYAKRIEDGVYELSWNYHNVGDYDQDGSVSISDITPVAERFFHSIFRMVWEYPKDTIVDGNRDLSITIQDITPIAENFFRRCASYSVQVAGTPGGPFSEISTIPFQNSSGDWRRFVETFSLTPGTYVRVVPVDYDRIYGEPSNVIRVPNPPLYPPNAVVRAEPINGVRPLEVNFDASESSDANGEIVSYEWDYEGDGAWDEETGTEPFASHTYTLSGIYEARVKVKDNDDFEDIASVRIGVSSPENQEPVAVLSAEPLSGYVPLTVNFDASASLDHDGTITLYLWDFDGNGYWDSWSETERWAQFTYDVAGNYTAKLTVWDDAGGVGTTEIQILAQAEPPPPPPPPPSTRGDWWMFGRDESHSRKSFLVGAQAPTLAWNFDDHFTASSPVVSNDGTIYYTSNRLYAVNPDGSFKWQSEPVSGYQGSLIRSPALGEDGTIFATFGTSELFAFGSWGQLKWMFSAGNRITGSPAVGENGDVYFGSNDGFLYCVEDEDGSLKWKFQVGSAVVATPAISEDGTIYFASAGNLYAVNPDGTSRWNVHVYDETMETTSSPALAEDGTIYFVGKDGLYAFNPDGSLKWKYDKPFSRTSPALGNNGDIYVSSGWDLYSISPDGRENWSYPAYSYSNSPAVDATGLIFIGSSSRTLHAITAEGFLRWSYDFGDSNLELGNPIIAGHGLLIVGTNKDGLFAFKNGESVPPTLILNASPTTGDEPLMVRFDASESYDLDGSIEKFEWDFDGDGIYDLDSTTEPFAEHTYEESGRYNVLLKATDNDGLQSYARIEISVVQTRWAVSGTVTQEIGSGLEQVTITLEPGGYQTLTGLGGFYTFPKVFNGSYTVTPSREDWKFTPDSVEVVVNSRDVTGVDFSAEWMGVGGRGDWWMFGREWQHRRRSESVGPKTPNLVWRYYVGNGYYTSPSLGYDGTVYVGGGGPLSAISPEGTLKWRWRNYEPTGEALTLAPAIDVDGVIYWGGGPYEYPYGIVSLNPDGTYRWSISISLNYNSSPVIGPDGTIYVGGAFNGKVYAIERDGTIKWEYILGGTNTWVNSSPALAWDRSLYVGAGDGKFYSFSYNGELNWTYQTGAGIHSSPALDDELTAVYFGSDDGYIYALDTSGKLKWRYRTDEPVYSSPGIASDGTVYVGSRDGYLYALNPEGTLKWRYRTNDVMFSSPAIDAEGDVYIGSLDDNIYAIDANGSLLWNYQTDFNIYGSPSISADGTLYCPGGDGYLYAFRDE